MTPKLDKRNGKNVELRRVESILKAKEEIHLEKEIDSNDADEKISAGSIYKEILQMKVEVALFLYTFSYIIRSISVTAMVMDKVCLVHLNQSEEICHNLTAYPAIKTNVEKMSSNYHLIHSLVQLMPSVVLGMFVGSWSDKYSRKIPVMYALAGMVIDGVGVSICAYFFESRVEYFYISALFTNMFGGYIAVLTVLYSYASDVTTTKKRTTKYVLMEMFLGISVPFGSLAGGWIFKFFGYVAVFATSSCGHLLGLFWVIFVLEETRGLDNKDTWQQKFLSFWSTESFKNSFKATTKKRPNSGRKQIWLLIAAMCIFFFSSAAMSSSTFFFVHHQFDWGNTTYSTVSSTFYFLTSITMLLIIPLSRRFQISDPCLGIIGSISLLLKNIGMGIATKTWIYYIACTAGLVSGLAVLSSRAKISKIVPADDLGKVFSFITTAEFIFPIIASAVVTQAFNASLNFFPGLVFVLMAPLALIPIGIFIWISRLPSANYELMQETSGKGEKCDVEFVKTEHVPDETHENIKI